MSDSAADRFLAFMKSPSMQSVPGYRKALEDRGWQVLAAEDTGLFAPCAELYTRIVGEQLAYDALKIIGFDAGAFESIGGESACAFALARARRLMQGRFIARAQG